MEIAVHLQQEHANLQDKLEILKEKSARLQEAEALVNDLCKRIPLRREHTP